MAQSEVAHDSARSYRRHTRAAHNGRRRTTTQSHPSNAPDRRIRTVATGLKISERLARSHRPLNALRTTPGTRQSDDVIPPIADDETHRALAYLVALDDVDYQPTTSEVDAYVKNPTRGTTGGAFSGAFSAAIAIQAINEGFYGRRHSMGDHLVTLQWAEYSEGGYRLAVTVLGRAVARSLARTATQLDSVIEMFVDPNDPLAVARVVSQIAEGGPGLLVDPYFRVNELVDVFNHTEIDRVLTGPLIGTKELDRLRVAVPKLIGRALEVRVAPDKTVHDRYVIGDAGRVLMLGTSLGSVGRVASVVVPVTDVREALVRSYRRIWKESASLGATRPEPPEAQTTSDASVAPAAAARRKPRAHTTPSNKTPSPDA